MREQFGYIKLNKKEKTFCIPLVSYFLHFSLIIKFSLFCTVHPKVALLYPIVRTLPGFKLHVCSTKGTPPVYTALTRNSTVLINTTDTDVNIRLHQEGNYTCVATGKYAVDSKEFSVFFNGKTSWKTIIN